MNRSFTRIFISTALMIVCSIHGNLQADTGEEKPAASADVALLTQYVWRGYGLSDESVVIQPSATVEYYGFSLNLWGNFDTDVPNAVQNQNHTWNETDWTLAYDRSVGPVAVGVGWIYYALDAVDDSQEVYLSLAVDSLLSPTLTAYREMAYYPGWYLNLGISHSFELFQEHGITLELAGSAGYLDADGDSGYFNEALVSAGVTMPLGDYLVLTPMIAYSFHLSGKAYDVLKANSLDNEANHVYGGITGSLAF